MFLPVDRSVDANLSSAGDMRDRIVATIYQRAEEITNRVCRMERVPDREWDRRLDDILTSRWLGFPVMLLLLGGVMWLTVTGANYPSALLANGLFWVEARLTDIFMWAGAPDWLHGLLVLGMYRNLAWVVSVMLPPMAIFFPLFTFLEDLGYLPRVAFNLDRFFKRAGAHGKQALTMSMGFGCNAAGVISCRIIESPRERLIAILTNNFVPCNGRFPTLIALASIIVGGVVSSYGSVVVAGLVVGIILIGILVTLLVSWLLASTVLQGVPSVFTLELPPYRKPQVGRLLVRSLLDRTIFVLARAVVVAAPAGAIIWLMANVMVGEISLLVYTAQLLAPIGRALGMDGYILVAFILGLPANEIVLPILIMGYLSSGVMIELGNLAALRDIFISQGWTWLTAVCMMLFSLLHYPCATTLITMFKETHSWRWTAIGALLPLAVAILVTFCVAQGGQLLGLV